MKLLVKLILVLLGLGIIGLIGYAYLGPLRGADFAAPVGDVSVPVTLDAQ